MSEGRKNMRSLPSDSVPRFNLALETAHELPLNFTGTRHPIASKNNMSSLPSNSVPGFNVALQTAQELPLNFTARRHPIASCLCLASVIASLDAPNRCAFVLHPAFPVVSYLPFLLVASEFASLYVSVRSAWVLHAVFASEFESKSRCIQHIAFLSVSSVRFLPV